MIVTGRYKLLETQVMVGRTSESNPIISVNDRTKTVWDNKTKVRESADKIYYN